MPKDIDHLIKEAVKKKRVQDFSKPVSENLEALKRLRNYISIPIIVGILAALVYYWQFGWEQLKEVLLAWLIGITLIATFIASLIKRNKK